MSDRVPVYDSGMLIALAARKAEASRIHAGLKAAAHRAIVPGVVLAQVWRPVPATIHALAVSLRDCVIPQARRSPAALRATTEGQTSCLMCTSALDLDDWQRLGNALSTAAIPSKKRPDVVDALVALTAVRHGSAAVFTSDPDDISAYLLALDAEDVQVNAV